MIDSDTFSFIITLNLPSVYSVFILLILSINEKNYFSRSSTVVTIIRNICKSISPNVVLSKGQLPFHSTQETDSDGKVNISYKVNSWNTDRPQPMTTWHYHSFI